MGKPSDISGFQKINTELLIKHLANHNVNDPTLSKNGRYFITLTTNTPAGHNKCD
ncbi:hypothetical Protein YC6258_01838 [Gynuella sunshinyii YC6258]|uniref:Uncharacterized protein n=1 Tax=Gynuella sunshinyii YC6258 TaxID=1445510 RepID=A0A0C5VGZ3_9GAMM|nr:hypothetical Protein YC6258_01838 [Gynuella sunshinyii YC6258]